MEDIEEDLVQYLEDYHEYLVEEKHEMLKEMVKEHVGEDDWLEAAKQIIRDVRIPSTENEKKLRRVVILKLDDHFIPDSRMSENKDIPDRYPKVLEAKKSVESLRAISGEREDHMWGAHHETFNLDNKEKIKELNSKFEEFPDPEESKFTDDDLEEIDNFINDFFRNYVSHAT